VSRILRNGADGSPLVEDISVAVADLAESGVDFLYVGSSSFLLSNADLLTGAALDEGLPLATAYEAMVRDSDALIALANAYYNVGQLAGRQAERILVDGATPGDLEVIGLDRFTVLINIDTAAKLGLYPPMLLLRYAEIIGGPQ
ncbi:MAG: ABC transporter substrate-binding protein, partial [Acidobacteria bacterium]